MISLSVAIRGRPPPPPTHPDSLRKPTYVVILSGSSKILFSSPAPRYSSSVPKRSSVPGVGAAKKTLHMSRGCRLYFPVARLPGRGKAEYGGLSLQSASLGYSTVISVRALTRSPALRRISVSPPPPRTFAPSGFQPSNGGPLHGRQSGAKTGERSAVFSLLCRRPPALPQPSFRSRPIFSSLNSSSCIFMTRAVHSSASSHGDVGLPSTGWECHVKPNATRVFIRPPPSATCGINVYEWKGRAADCDFCGHAWAKGTHSTPVRLFLCATCGRQQN